MKTLIFNGSPRKNGDTALFIGEFIRRLGGEIRVVDAYRCRIHPCVDCRYCRERKGCRQQDEMQEIYGYIEDCDTIAIASPIYFSELTGPLLSVLSRLQTYYCARVFRKETPIPKIKNGVIILSGGGDGSPDKAVSTATTLLHHMNATKIYPEIVFHDSDKMPGRQSASTLTKIQETAQAIRNSS